jgi:hypothetical protein
MTAIRSSIGRAHYVSIGRRDIERVNINDRNRDSPLSTFSLPNDPGTLEFGQELAELSGSVFDHPVLKCRFYEIWRNNLLSINNFHVFSINYFFRVYATTTRIATAISTIDDWESRLELLHNISDELGNGSIDNVHVLVLFRWLESLNERLGCKAPFRDLLDNAIPLETTTEFILKTRALCAATPQEAAGALLAQEWHGYTQISYLFDGFLNYRHLYESSEFHDVSEYFYVHLGRAEKEHRVQSSKIALRICKSEHDFIKIRDSFLAYLKCLEEFWDGIVRYFPDAV